MGEIVSFIQNTDLEILNLIQRYLKSSFMDSFMVFITTLGNKGLVWILISLLLMIKKEYRKIGLYALLALILVTVLGEGILKNAIGRVRPFVGIEGMELLIKEPRSFSFPSGHTAIAFVMASVLGHKIKRMRIPLYILASLIAFSRLYLFVHNPSDIVAGIILGFLCSTFIIFLYENDNLLLKKVIKSKKYHGE